ncbi:MULTISPECIES: SDR family NAD(P)-dependent oxidoreductase [Nocardia]|uniref:3-alpha-(Or 20-beta)-hydroxysteroid dehydrogenase n=2 Tax=Nocardia TaxID=1817 RepID=K0F1R8_NOCB7|nr:MULTISPECIES: SDR family oxidoreductase [Nocardia]AFU01606.1 3-alpha-(or 20-beta)-hydroxysteroid dehydrogenase [Nocardia brasiliensis ATCC 700358]KIA62497.1 3-alpha-hydroxysteroid dehydrogenase [Nocardia vulneris]OCF85819.1 3-alpha-hydroxysteroid dehydrogenase [Nocardia brasiliensis]
MNNFSGRSAIVTGGARGIGAAIVRALAKENIAVVVADLLEREGTELARSLGPNVMFQRLDVTDKSMWRDVIDQTAATFGPLAILVNNAGILDFGSIEDESPAMFRHVVEVNLYGSWLGMHMAVPHLRAGGGGVIVNISSTAGLVGYAGIGGYVASKWGLRGLTKAAALELGRDDIRVCSVHPGPIHTPMTAGLDESMAAAQPLARFGEPDEVAAMVRFLITEATFSTGSEFVLDGGATAGAAG